MSETSTPYRLSGRDLEAFVESVVEKATASPRRDAEEIINEMRVFGWGRLGRVGWQTIAREVIRQARSEPWPDGTRLVVKKAGLGEPWQITGFAAGERVFVLSLFSREPVRYEVERDDGMTQILTKFQLEFPWADYA